MTLLQINIQEQRKSYSAFKSKIEVIDAEQGKTFKDSVYMNHILDYRGFRFFQAGFDPDESGTHLSVSHDFWGNMDNLYWVFLAVFWFNGYFIY